MSWDSGACDDPAPVVSWDSGACDDPAPGDEHELGGSALQHLDSLAIDLGGECGERERHQWPPDELARRRLRRHQRPS